LNVEWLLEARRRLKSLLKDTYGDLPRAYHPYYSLLAGWASNPEAADAMFDFFGVPETVCSQISYVNADDPFPHTKRDPTPFIEAEIGGKSVWCAHENILDNPACLREYYRPRRLWLDS
jgi:hypothetical protein